MTHTNDCCALLALGFVPTHSARLTTWEHDQRLLNEAGGSFMGLVALLFWDVFLLAKEEICQRDGEGKVWEL